MKDVPIKIIECPRDAMQGLHQFVPTSLKIEYINQLLKVGFDTLDFGSFVSPKAIPQMKDTAEVLSSLELSDTKTKLLAIIANQRGAMDAVMYNNIEYLGYPFSISETFQIRNTNATIENLWKGLPKYKISVLHTIKSWLFIFPWVSEILMVTFGVLKSVRNGCDRLTAMDIKILALSDTIGVATPDSIAYLFKNLIPPYPDVEFGAHLHTQKHNWKEKIEAAFDSGCRRFDGALKGYGGCPMAKDELTGNMPTENIISFFEEKKVFTGIEKEELAKAEKLTFSVFKY
jgi:hydroxymethylglutaryl-CoA lyase